MKRNIFSTVVTILLFSGLLSVGQTKPEVAVRFFNPQYICETETYCLDVQFKSDTDDQQLFGMNLRFYYDDNILEYLGASDFRPGYGLTGAPLIATGPGSAFGMTGPADWVNGSVQLINENQLDTVLPTTYWQTLFRICFHVDDPAYFNVQTFCPSVVWDLQENWQEEEGGGFQPGDDGVVMTVVDPDPLQDSKPSSEIVVQFNWQYGGNPNGFGHPVELIRIDTFCGYIIPVSNWALFLGIGLMILATLFIYRRRMS